MWNRKLKTVVRKRKKSSAASKNATKRWCVEEVDEVMPVLFVQDTAVAGPSTYDDRPDEHSARPTSNCISTANKDLNKGRLLGKVDAYFSSFRRCNYPRVTAQGVVEIVEECGRYSRFWDIPSPWWQASTVLVGVGSALSLLVAVTATAACCITYVVHTGTARIAGTLQFIAALLVCGGAAVYPVGWDNREVRESCGNLSSVYHLGTCELSWSVYLLGSAVSLLLLCFGLSFCASRVKPGSFRI